MTTLTSITRNTLVKTAIATSLFLSALSANADVLALKDGQSISGKFISGNTQEIMFEIAGQQLKFENAKVKGITFESSTVAATATPTAEAVPVSQSVTVPIGTRLIVRTSTDLSTNKHSKGHKFNAKLEGDIVVNGIVVAPRGSLLYGVVSESKKSRRLAGKASMSLTFTDILINNEMIAIRTSSVSAISESAAKSTLARSAKTAAIGGLIDGSDGAKTGAKVGLGLSVLGGGKSIQVPAGSLLEFGLDAPFTY